MCKRGRLSFQGKIGTMTVCDRNFDLLHCRTSHLASPGGYFQIRRSGGLDLTSSLEAKFGARSGQVHQTKRKNLGSSVTTRRKSWEKVPILGSYLKFRGQNLGYLSFIFLEAKFGAPTRISEAKFGAKPLRPPNMDVPPWVGQPPI